MIRTLAIITAVGFVLAIICFSGAVAVAGGPFWIGEGWRFHRSTWTETPAAAAARPDSTPGAV